MNQSNFGYNPRKAAQVAAFFAMREGGLIDIGKLTRLIYLADRAFMEKYDEPMLMDTFISLKDGPANSRTYQHITGDSAKKDT